MHGVRVVSPKNKTGLFNSIPGNKNQYFMVFSTYKADDKVWMIIKLLEQSVFACDNRKNSISVKVDC